MIRVATEASHDQSEGLDAKEPRHVASILLAGQAAAASCVDAVIDEIAAASELAAGALKNGGRLVYAGAGSSGLIAMIDALELPGTYGIPRDRIAVLLAGGPATCQDMQGGPEDDVDLAHSDVEKVALDDRDCVIVVAASGATPYTRAIAECAAKSGSGLIAIANNPGVPIFERADVSIFLETPPEVISGSTRMGAGTAQKIALNTFSTLTGIRLGHVHDGYMVNLRADNEKLRDRAGNIVSAITGLSGKEAGAWLDKADGSVKLAVLLADGAGSVGTAKKALSGSGENLREARRNLDEQKMSESAP